MGRTFWIFIALLFGCTLNYGYGADPVLTWSSWTDSVGNTADANSDVTWAPIPLPANSTYKGGSVTYDSRGLGPLNDFAKAFINGAVFPSGISWGRFYLYSQICLMSFFQGNIRQVVVTNHRLI
jgi:hypothetical protein